LTQKTTIYVSTAIGTVNGKKKILNYKGLQYIIFTPFHKNLSFGYKDVVGGDIHTQKDMVMKCLKLVVPYEMWTLPNNTFL
jgi:hypothetical protein